MDALARRDIELSRAELVARQTQTLRRVPVLVPTLCQVLHGRKTLQWQGRTMHADTRHLVLLPAGAELGVINEPGVHGYRAVLIGLSTEALRRFCARHAGVVYAPPSSAGLCAPMTVHVAQAWAALREGLQVDAPMLLQQHLLEGVLLALALDGKLAPLLPGHEQGLAARVEALLLFNPGADWSAAAVAHELHLGVSTLRRRLAAEGRPLRRILDEVRMSAALTALQNGRQTIGEIAAQCGYASASRFAVRFRHRFGLSPRALRQTL